GGERVVLAIGHDATDRAHLEQRLRQGQKMEALGRMAAGIAHDFNNLLTVINGYADVLLADGAAGPFRAGLEEVSKAGARAAEMVRQLLAFSRQQPLRMEAVDLNALVADTVGLLCRLVGDGVEVVPALAPGLGPVLADPGQLVQVLLNLAAN